MTKISNSVFMKIFVKLLILLALAKTVSLGVWWYFPSEGVELNIESNFQPKYQRVDFKNMINDAKSAENPQDKQDTNSGISITNMVLKGLYGTKERGYVIVAMKSKPKDTSIIAVKEVYQGFTLKSITGYSAIFEKGGKDYVLELEELKTASSITKVPKQVNYDEPIGVSRNDISFYAKNPNDIWKDISIHEIKEGNVIKGFKVTKISAGSKFETLGLKKGDIIIKANNVTLKSYRDAIEIYNNINKLDAVEIVIMRNNQEMELVYEIN
ncbi:PDZ domain-containing protein [bacterium]|nr:PDZ domain-containing protein [bacterium]MBU1990569.1 PDZ domain-containing protein [bacterium]